MNTKNIVICNNCGTEHLKTNRCTCYYQAMDNQTKKPRKSGKLNPILFFTDFLRNRNAYCLLYQFYKTAKNNKIDETEEKINLSFIDPIDGYNHKSHIYYYDYVDITLTNEKNNSIEIIQETLAENDFTGRKDFLMNLIDQLQDLIKVGMHGEIKVNILGNSQIADGFIEHVQSLIYFTQEKLTYYISHEPLVTELTKKSKKNKKTKPPIEIEPDSIEDIIQGGAKKEFDLDFDKLVDLNYFELSNGKFIFIQKIPDLVAIVERWKRKKWLLEKYWGYSNQNQICYTVYNSYLKNSSLYKQSYVEFAFKKSKIVAIDTNQIQDKFLFIINEIELKINQ